MFDEDVIYPGVRTCSRGIGFVSLSPCQSHMPFHILIQIYLLSVSLSEWPRHIFKFGSKFPKEEFTYIFLQK